MQRKFAVTFGMANFTKVVGSVCVDAVGELDD